MSYKQLRFEKSSLILSPIISADTRYISKLFFEYFENGKPIGNQTTSFRLFSYRRLGRLSRYGKWYCVNEPVCYVFDSEKKKIVGGCLWNRLDGITDLTMSICDATINVQPKINLVLRDSKDPYFKELPFIATETTVILFTIGLICSIVGGPLLVILILSIFIIFFVIFVSILKAQMMYNY